MTRTMQRTKEIMMGHKMTKTMIMKEMWKLTMSWLLNEHLWHFLAVAEAQTWMLASAMRAIYLTTYLNMKIARQMKLTGLRRFWQSAS
jgi:hypothetical protein